MTCPRGHRRGTRHPEGSGQGPRPQRIRAIAVGLERVVGGGRMNLEELRSTLHSELQEEGRARPWWLEVRPLWIVSAGVGGTAALWLYVCGPMISLPRVRILQMISLGASLALSTYAGVV